MYLPRPSLFLLPPHLLSPDRREEQPRAHVGPAAGLAFSPAPHPLLRCGFCEGEINKFRSPIPCTDPMWERPTHARILVRDDDAGRVIGKAGSSIAAIEASSGAHIKLSGRDQLLHSTDRCVVFVSGGACLCQLVCSPSYCLWQNLLHIQMCLPLIWLGAKLLEL